MGAHAALPAARARRAPAISTASWAVPLTIGVLYGFYVAFIARVTSGGHITTGKAVLGIVSGLVMAVLCFLLGRYQRSMKREMRAVAYGALCGVSTGFLFSLTGHSVLRSSSMGFVLGLGLFLVMFYYFYTHEE
ncbi:hypothetical protein GCM10020367_33540 [Streptomyces sannanensis]|uniref:Uncharacterized protein n=1 Tax=Streptomyces sannanensis TaxID=285536 RepID=A0ABP6SCM6_9ACTN